MKRTIRVPLARSVLTVAFVLATLLVTSQVAVAYCSGLTSYAGTWGAYGTSDFYVWDNVTLVQGRIDTYTPDPVVSNSTSWVMLADRVRNKVAQTGWIRKGGWSGDWIWAQFWDNTGAYEAYFNSIAGSTRDYATSYTGSGRFAFAYEGIYWYQTWDLGWSPNKIQIASESKNHGDHFPGSNVQNVKLLKNIQYIKRHCV